MWLVVWMVNVTKTIEKDCLHVLKNYKEHTSTYQVVGAINSQHFRISCVEHDVATLQAGKCKNKIKKILKVWSNTEYISLFKCSIDKVSSGQKLQKHFFY